MDKDTEEFEGGAGGSSISADLIRGHINTIILRSLYDEDKYGYEIINEINEKSHGQYTLKQPTLYSALKRLENQGYIQAYWKHDEVSAGGRRKYFRLTESGRQIAETNRAEWEYSRTVIDNLISDRNFDFSKPAPTPVDFKILKQATSRVPIVHSEGDGHESEGDTATADAENGMPECDTSDEDGQHVTLVTGTSDTVYIDDPASQEKRPDVTLDEKVEEPSQSPETEIGTAYSESIISDSTQSAEIQITAEKNAPQPAIIGSTDEPASPHSAGEESAADYYQAAIAGTENSPEEFARSTVSAHRNDPEDFAMPSDGEIEYSEYIHESAAATENAPEDYIQPSEETAAPHEELTQPTAEPGNAPEEFTQPPAHAEKQYEKASRQAAAPSAESAPAEAEAPEDDPIYSLPSQSYAQAVPPETYRRVPGGDGAQYYATPEEEARRIAHENYIRLIDGDAGRDEQSDRNDAANLVYNLRSENERDYKNLIDKLFDNTISNEPEPIYQPAPEPEPEPEPEPVYEHASYTKASFFDAGDKAAADGLKISTSDEAFAAGSAKQTTYNKGATLFKCSLIVGVIILLEFTLILLFRNNINVPLAYPIVILVLGLALILVCGILFGTGYGINVRKPTNLRYIMTMVIITVLVIAIIFIAAIAMNVDWTNGTDILKKIILPCVIALNIPIFTLSFYLFTK